MAGSFYKVSWIPDGEPVKRTRAHRAKANRGSGACQALGSELGGDGPTHRTLRRPAQAHGPARGRPLQPYGAAAGLSRSHQAPVRHPGGVLPALVGKGEGQGIQLTL